MWHPVIMATLAMPVDDLDAAREFYGNVLGCAQGRSDTTWVDWDLRGHQVVTQFVAFVDNGPQGAALRLPSQSNRISQARREDA